MVPRVASRRPARRALLAALVLAAVLPEAAPPSPGGLIPVGGPSGCVLATAGEPCDCGALPTTLRRVLGLPIPFARASAADLEALPGVGPARAAALLAARSAGRPPQTARGIGPLTWARLEPLLHVEGPDPACAWQEGILEERGWKGSSKR